MAPGLDKFRSNPCLCSKKTKTTVLLRFPKRNVELSLPLILKFPQKGNVLSFWVAKAEQMPLSSTPLSFQYSSIPFFKLIVQKITMQLIFHRINTHTHTSSSREDNPKFHHIMPLAQAWDFGMMSILPLVLSQSWMDILVPMHYILELYITTPLKFNSGR